MKKTKKIKSPHLSSSYFNVQILERLRLHLDMTVSEIACVLGIDRTSYHRILARLKTGKGVLRLDIDLSVQIALTVVGDYVDNSEEPLSHVEPLNLMSTHLRIKVVRSMTKQVTKLRARGSNTGYRDANAMATSFWILAAKRHGAVIMP